MCTVMLNASVSVALREINETFAKDEKVDRECLLNSLLKDHFEDEVYKRVVYGEAKHLLAIEKDEKLRIAERNFTEFIINRTADCLDSKKFLKLMLEEKDSSEELSVNQNFCARRFVIYKNLLDINDYKIDENYEKIDSKKVDCNAEISKLRQEIDQNFKNGLSDSQKECYTEKTKEAQIFENLVWIKVLKDNNATEKLKDKEQKRFDEFFPRFFRNFTLCQL